jgi:uncharacterized protein (TIGR02646 family)
MKLIKKSNEPSSLQVHRGQAGTDYESFKRDVGLGNIYPAKGLRKSLLDEQGYICAYCMKRIPHSHTEHGVKSDKMKVEHYIPQTNATSIANKLDISYTNMFACCMGNHGQKEEFETCDTRKGESSLTITPLNAAHIRTLKYGVDGSIYSTDATFETEINQILNLNEDNLKRQREAIHTLIEKRVRTEFATPHLTREEKNSYLDSQIKWWNSKKDGKYQPFCMVAINYLESRKR